MWMVSVTGDRRILAAEDAVFAAALDILTITGGPVGGVIRPDAIVQRIIGVVAFRATTDRGLLATWKGQRTVVVGDSH